VVANVFMANVFMANVFMANVFVANVVRGRAGAVLPNVFVTNALGGVRARGWRTCSRRLCS